ncbi:hypothetical protein ADUPG1_010184 [Aduncisulcus paluster]|uniref:Uncharacterized protein n=1 Tax=Aduncisulcus paluster TaxID=2918883 RepID=A0ABQ5JQT3_9EUKA|nr:hypothetical protein ADUPG1_010184 [Aduncisulcus paluster]
MPESKSTVIKSNHEERFFAVPSTNDGDKDNTHDLDISVSSIAPTGLKSEEETSEGLSPSGSEGSVSEMIYCKSLRESIESSDVRIAQLSVQNDEQEIEISSLREQLSQWKTEALRLQAEKEQYHDQWVQKMEKEHKSIFQKRIKLEKTYSEMCETLKEIRKIETILQGQLTSFSALSKEISDETPIKMVEKVFFEYQQKRQHEFAQTKAELFETKRQYDSMLTDHHSLKERCSKLEKTLLIMRKKYTEEREKTSVIIQTLKQRLRK